MADEVVTTYEPFSPAAALAEQYPDWIVCDYSIPFASEIICWHSRVIVVDSSWYDDLDWSLAHAWAHLVLDHGNADGAPFTAEQQRQAGELARLWLDMDLDDWYGQRPRPGLAG